MPIVELPDGRELEFPDGTSQEVMRSAIQKNFPELHQGQGKPVQNSVDRIKSITGMDRTPIDTLRDFATGAISGLGKGGQTIASALTGGRAPTVDFDKLLAPSYSPKKSIGGEIVKGMGEYLPYGAAGGASLAGQLAGGAAAGAALTPSDDTNMFGLFPQGKIGGALKYALINALTHGAFKSLENLRPSKIFRGNLSPEQLSENLKITEGTNTGLGDVIESPYLKRQYENVLPHIPFSGANQFMLNTAHQVRQQGENLLNDIGVGENSGNQGLTLQNALKDAAKEARNEKNKSYDQLNEMADKAKVIIGRGNFSKKAADALEDIKASPELMREFPSDLKADLENYASNQNGNNLKLSNIFKGKLGDKANDLYVNGKMHEYGIVKGLQDALQKDINTGIENSGNQSLKDQYIKSQKDYAEKYAPFEDPDIVKFTRQGGDSDLILSHFLKTGQNDRANLMTKVTSKLPQSQSRLPLQMYLSKAIEDGQVNPLKLRTLYNKLGKNQKNILIQDPTIRKSLEKYVDLVGKNTEPLTLMFNPKTGQRNIDTLTTGILGLLGHGLAGNYGALAASSLPILAGKSAAKMLTSPSFRESLVKEMIENKPKFTAPFRSKGREILIQGLSNALNKGNK